MSGRQMLRWPADRALMENEDLDHDTRVYGARPPFERWEADSTGMVHVLWAARSRGWTLEKNADEIAAMVMRSRWLRAVEHFATPTTTDTSPSDGAREESP